MRIPASSHIFLFLGAAHARPFRIDGQLQLDIAGNTSIQGNLDVILLWTRSLLLFTLLVVPFYLEIGREVKRNGSEDITPYNPIRMPIVMVCTVPGRTVRILNGKDIGNPQRVIEEHTSSPILP